jgi:hypothetical protein
MVKKYIKKPVEVEAVQWTGENSHEIDMFVFDCEHHWYKDTLVIETLAGDRRVLKGDWIIKNVKGEFYPCRADIFAQTYDEAAA